MKKRIFANPIDTMTIENYTPEKLDQCALRVFDIAAELRFIAVESRKHGLQSISIHDRNALLWIEKLELWAKKSKIGFEMNSIEVAREKLGS